MKNRLLLPSLLVLLGACRSPQPTGPDYGRELPIGAAPLIPLGPGEAFPSVSEAWLDRVDLFPALKNSIAWTNLPYSEQFFPAAGISHRRALASLKRFHQLLEQCQTGAEFQAAVEAEFDCYKSAGWDGRGGGVLFTGYCTPVLDGSLKPDASYRYPLYALPPDLVKASDGTILGRKTPTGIEPYPTRREIESSGMLEGQGLELVWLRDPLDAFIAHVNGSAFVRTQDGTELRFGYAGKNGQPYTSMGGELVRDGRISRDALSLGTLRAWASQNPGLVEEYTHRNDSYVFFTPIDGNPRGSLNLEVQAHRTIATDKTLFPRGALVVVDTILPMSGGGYMPFQQVMLDQDTGGAIRTAGRADIYLGVGHSAERLAGTTRSEGQMYYLFLKSESLQP
ncbi:MAG TPA: MltA domain-containing protein [Planctomycetota bacterium]|nr:MltA domain-containing protein [Planctomycetota bacterium]HRV82646.1 MltA domain-containing protein [Planctomycetota bacterium]